MGRSSDDHQRNLQRFHHKSKILLNSRERDYLHDVLKQYHAYKDLKKLMKCLLTVLDTPAKLDLLIEVRGLLPKVHLAQFDWLAPYAKMAHPIILSGGQSGGNTTNGSVKHMRKTRSDGSVRGTNGVHANPGTAVRMVTIDKDSDTLGFSIHGGSENGKGIFISSVERGSVEESLGLGAGDQILEVNNISFDNITKSSASMVLQGNSRLRLKVQHWGRVHGNRMAKEKTSWYDTVQRMIVAGEFNDVDPSHAAMGGTRLLRGGDERRVIITLSSNRCIGFNIRGGMEYGVGIYVSKVDQGGLAESHGITVGDQIIDVNGVTTENATHAQAVELIRNQRCLIMTIRSVNRYPAYKELCNEYEWPVRDTHQKRRHSSSPTSGTNPLLHNEFIDAIPLEVAEQYTQTHAHNESRDWQPNQSITMSPTPIPKSSRSSVATETATLIQKHIALPSTETGTCTSTDPPVQTSSQAQSSTQAPVEPASPNTDKRIGRSHSMKFPGEKALPSFETETSKKESQRVQRNRTFREVLFGMKMKSKDKKEKADKQRGDKKTNLDPKHLKKRYPSSAAYASLNKKPPADQTADTVSRSESSTSGWAVRKDNQSLVSSNPGSIARRHPPKQPTPVPAPFIPNHQRPSDPGSAASGTQLPAAFKHGAGTQLMYSEATYASAMNVLDEMAKKLLNEDEQCAVMRHVKWYHQEGRIENLVPPMLAILDKPEKILLLREIRGVIAPSDLGRFDSMVSRKELQAYENLQSGRKDPSQPIHSMRRNSIGKPKKTILETKTDHEGKFFLQTPEDIQQDKRRQKELEELRMENLKEVSEESEEEEDGDSNPAADTNSLDNSDIVMSLFEKKPTNDFISPQSKSDSPDSNQSQKILNVPSSPKEPKAKQGLWTDIVNSNWEDEIVVAVREVTVEKSPVTLEGHQQGSSSGATGGPKERVGRESGFGSGDEHTEKDSRETSDPDLIPHVYLSQIDSGDEGGANWMLPNIEDDSLEDNMSNKEPTKIYDEDICGLDDSDEDVELPKFDDDDSSNSDAADVKIKPNKSGLYSLVGTNNYHQDIGNHSNATSPAWSSPNTFSPISATSDMSLPPTPISSEGLVSPTVPKTPPNSGIDLSTTEPIYAKVDLSRKRSNQSARNSLSVEGSFDGSEGSESGRRSPFKVTFTEYRGSPLPSKKSILKNSFRKDEAPSVAKRKISSDYMDIEDINLGGSSASKEINSSQEPPAKNDISKDGNTVEQLNAQMETMTVSLTKNRPSLGISISGGNDSKNQPEVRIDRIFPGGAASDDGTLQAGFEVLSVDGESLLSVSHPQAVDIIRKAYHDKNKSTIEFVIKQTPELDTHL